MEHVITELVTWFDALSGWKLGTMSAIGGSLLTAMGYLFKRHLEGSPEKETIAQLSSAADLKEKLNKNNLTLEDVQKFRSEALQNKANDWMSFFQMYMRRVQNLIIDVEHLGAPGDETPRLTSESEVFTNSALSQSEMNLLSQQGVAEAEADLNAAVVDLIQRLSSEEALALQRSQAAWQMFRQAEAAREAKRWEGGTICPLMVNLAVEAITRERIASLKADIIGPEGVALEIQPIKTPSNLLQIVTPGVPKQRVLDLLKTPSHIHGEHWDYEYEDTIVHVTFNSDGAVELVTVCLRHGCRYSGDTASYYIDKPLGLLTLGDVLQSDPALDVQYRWTMRTEELIVLGRCGPSGAWIAYCYGALSTPYGPMQDVRFQWDREGGKLLTSPNDVLINWMALPSDTLEAPYCN